MLRRFVLGVGMLTVMLAGCGTSDSTASIGADGREAYQALIKLRSAAEVGTSYAQYNAQLVEAHAAAELFLNRSLSGSDAELATPLKAALEAFATANQVLRIQNEAGRPSVFSGNVYYDELVQTYPPATNFAKEVAGVGTSEIRIPLVLEEIFNEANAALAKATQLVQSAS